MRPLFENHTEKDVGKADVHFHAFLTFELNGRLHFSLLLPYLHRNGPSCQLLKGMCGARILSKRSDKEKNSKILNMMETNK
jgi:hypothetical protein